MSRRKITADLYLKTCKRRFGTTNPERIDNPVWEWMVRERHTPYSARQALGLEPDYGVPRGERTPDWCFHTRMGTPVIKLADGREVSIAGEYEDWYHPDFCIYNDVVVRRGEDVRIYAYPREVFPPTDFHTATLIGDTVWLIGSLGYPEERWGAETQVMALHAETLEIRRVIHSGPCPGWLHGHRAVALEDGRTIEVSGGQILAGCGDKGRSWRDNIDTFQFDTTTAAWTRTTDRSRWRQFRVYYEHHMPRLEPGDNAALARYLGSRNYAWSGGELLHELGHPVRLALDDGPSADGDRAHYLVVEGVRVRICDRYGGVSIVVQGELSPPTVDDLMDRLRALIESADRSVTLVEETTER